MLSAPILCFLLLFLGTLIFFMFAEPSRCNGWCCRVNGTRVLNDMKPNELSVTLKSYCKEEHGKYSNTLSGVNIMDTFLSGLSVLSIPHQPIYSICKLAAQKNNIHKNVYPFIGISGKQGNRFELYATAFLSQALLRPKNAVIIMTGMTSTESPAFQAWHDLIQNDIVHWYEQDIFRHGEDCWVKGTMKSIDQKTSVSEYINHIFCQYLHTSSTAGERLSHPRRESCKGSNGSTAGERLLKHGSTVRYYVTSREREDEIIKAYKNDTSFVVDNVTSAIHGCVLKILLPHITLSIAQEGRGLIEEERRLFPRAIEFLQAYILV